MDDRARLKLLIEHVGIRRNTLAKELGYTNASVFYQIEIGRNGISANLAKKIAKKYPEINQNWLLTGKGKMILEDTIKIDVLEKKVESLEINIKGLSARLELLEQKFKQLTANNKKQK